jgi:hypothetical protein
MPAFAPDNSIAFFSDKFHLQAERTGPIHQCSKGYRRAEALRTIS